MIHQDTLFENNLKTLGLATITEKKVKDLNNGTYNNYIKILFLPEDYKVRVDFNEYVISQQALFFVAPNQFLQIEGTNSAEGYLIFYNSDFYCLHIHDAEVACDGLLFNNINHIPQVDIDDDEVGFINFLFHQIEAEFKLEDGSMEEMIRTYLKQLLIKATRLWKQQHLDKVAVNQKNDLEFFRKFMLLVDAHYKKKHRVADYADLLFMAPKTITHKFRRLQLPQPNDIIKNRIVLEAKRFLAHTSMTTKEIAYELGYEDPAYFSKLFKGKTNYSPSDFRASFNKKPVLHISYNSHPQTLQQIR